MTARYGPLVCAALLTTACSTNALVCDQLSQSLQRLSLIHI